MIPRMEMPRSASRRRPEWPEPVDRHSAAGALFEERPPLRKLTVLVDVDVLDLNEPPEWDQSLILKGLLTHSCIARYWYADEGPPADAPRVSLELWTAVKDWAVLGKRDEDGFARPVSYANDHQIHRGAVVGNVAEVARSDTRAKSYRQLSPEKAAEKREADALAVRVAEVIGADIFVTRRSYVRESKWARNSGLTICDVDECLALVGLYLRSQHEHLYWRSPDGRGTCQMNRGLFFWVGTRELVPSAWRWFYACMQHSVGTGNDALSYLGGSVLQRVERALQTRDDVHRALNQPQNNDTADAALASLDTVLLLLVGALDAAARVAHTVLAMDPDKLYTAAWQQKSWQKELKKVCPKLAALVTNDSPGQHVLTILKHLRNSVHGSALQALGFRKGIEPLQTLLGLPEAEVAEIRAAMRVLGGERLWGVSHVLPDRPHVDPGILLERLFPLVLELINGLMDETPVENLSHVTIRPENTKPPEKGPDDPFHERTRLSIRWQLGF
ncbi:hypothetical protein AB0B56_35045 [Streptosporangium canum]|uniref:hypothetical protein n=1 Tax=Streptosporangium canum TaxID=324952 RepID=UPI00343131A2